MCLRPTFIQMYDWYAPELADHYAPDELRGIFSNLKLRILAATHPIHKPDYSDVKRRRSAGSYCFLLEKNADFDR